MEPARLQVTSGEFNNWFPHGSPDGRKTVRMLTPADGKIKRPASLVRLSDMFYTYVC